MITKEEKLQREAEYRDNNRPVKFPKNTVRSRQEKARKIKGEGKRYPTVPEKLKGPVEAEIGRRANGALKGHSFSLPIRTKRAIMKCDPVTKKILKIYESAMAAAQDIAGPGLTVESAHSGIQAAAKTCKDKKQHICGGFAWEWKPVAKGARK